MNYGDKKHLYVEDFQYLIQGARSKHIKVICPLCHDRRSDKRDRSLSIDVTTLAYKCHYCEAAGYLKSKMSECMTPAQKDFKPKKRSYIPIQKKDGAVKQFSTGFLDYFKGRGISESTLKEAKVTMEAENFGKGRIGCIAFNYYLGDNLINVKHRTRDKQFRLVQGAELIPYNINSIAPEAYEDGEEKSCFFVEGEMDALTYIECGYKHVVSVPNGANPNLTYLDDFIESHFDKLDAICISTDNDRKGLEVRNELIRRFGRDMCRIIDYPKPCKDINEVLMQYGKEGVDECVKSYTELKLEGIQEVSDVETDLDYMFHNGLQKGYTIGVPDVDKILSFKTGMLNIVTGVPTHGKTYMLNFILARLNLLHDWKIAFFSPEFYPVSLHISQMIETLGGARFDAKNYNQQTYELMKDYLCKNMFWIDPDQTDIQSVMERARYLIRKKGIKALVIDPFNALTDSERKTAKQDEYISEFLQKLRWFARKYDVAVFIVMHPVKQTKLETGLYPVCDLYACKGASEINDKADIGLTVWRNEKEDYAELHVTKIKFRHLGEKGCTAFKFNINNGRYVSIGDAENLKKSGISIANIPVEWDNTNWVVQKIKGCQVQQDLPIQEESTSSPSGYVGDDGVYVTNIPPNYGFENTIEDGYPF